MIDKSVCFFVSKMFMPCEHLIVVLCVCALCMVNQQLNYEKQQRKTVKKTQTLAHTPTHNHTHTHTRKVVFRCYFT